MADWKPPTFEGEIKNYTPTLRDRITYGISGLMSGKGELGPDRESMTRARMIANALEYTPLGLATAADDVTRAGGRGDYVGAGTTLAMAGMPGPTPKGIKAYHGSPHSFDKFDMSKIGTGEGAQAYGHGLYFAENEGVAQNYRNNLSRGNIDATYGNAPLKTSSDWYAMVDNLNRRGSWRQAKLLDQYGKTGGPLEDYIRQQRDWYRGDKEMEAALGNFEQLMQSKWTPGSMYEVQINADPDQFLDWDKPLSEQPQIAEAITNAYPDPQRELNRQSQWEAPGWSDTPKGTPYRNAIKAGTEYQALGGELGNFREASERLKKAGIPGIKYLDQGSRAKGDGSRNYVVFDDKLIDIKRKYALLAALLGGGGLAAATNTGEVQAGTPQPQGGGGW